ncbi:MAG: chemotaxis-specific protein-glutamate methyltransferase CheB [bacterium]|nr:chemotaxis-specific protein-glutamate methyltransferase CheB [bacterium]
MRIAIAGDALLTDLRDALSEHGEYRVVWIARSGKEAVQRCVEEKPELLLLDPNLCNMEGVEAVRRIMRETPCPILLVTETLEDNTAKIFEAMGYGALDAVSMPRQKYDEQKALIRLALFKKINTIEKLTRGSFKNGQIHDPRQAAVPRTAVPRTAVPRTAVPHLVAIGASAGGPKTLAALFSQLPVSFQSIIIVVQHVDNMFSTGFVKWLNAQTVLRVRLAVPGDFPNPGNVYVAGSNDHLVLTSRMTFSYNPEPREMSYRPSIDVLFKSVAKHWPAKGKAILLTGMGRDGAEGLAILRKAGWHTIAQNQASSIVYGMPKAARELGAAVEILSLDEIASSLLKNARS